MAPAAHDNSKNGAPTPPPPMAAVTAITNPISQDQYWAFYNDANNQLGVAQQFKRDLGAPLYDFSSSAVSDVPTGTLANPSSMCCVSFQSQVNVYGVLQGTTQGDLLVCRLSPGFQLLNLLNPPLANSSSIAACSDGGNNGTLFYLTQDATQTYVINYITLPGIQSAPRPTNINISLNPKTYLGAAYGSLTGMPADSYVGLQNRQKQVCVCPRARSLSATITQANGRDNTPIAMVFVGNRLVVYFFGSATSTNPSPVYRAVTEDLNNFTFTNLTNAPSPNGYTQLAVFPNAGPQNDGLGTTILTYVEFESNQLVSWEDDLSKYKVSGAGYS